MFKKEVKGVTYSHEVDTMHASQKSLERVASVKPNASITEAINAVGDPGRLKIQHNVGKRPETKSIQGLK